MQGVISCAVTMAKIIKPFLKTIELKVWLFDVDVFQPAFSMVDVQVGDRLSYHEVGSNECELARDSTYSTKITVCL